MLVQIAAAASGEPMRLIERDRLEIAHHMRWTETSFEHAIEYRLDGTLVRRDVWVNMLRGQAMTPAGGAIGG